MGKKVIGILGGMGPEATVECFRLIVENTPAERDQDHLHVLVNSNPGVPDRTEAILGRGESPVPLMAEGCNTLERAGADFVIIPCVSAHFFLDDVKRKVRIPILSVFDIVAETLEREFPDIRKVGLMGTTGTVRGGLFQKRLARSRIETVVCTDDVQKQVMKAIYDIKSGKLKELPTEVRQYLVKAAESLIDNGAKAIIAGCTEIPLGLTQEDLQVPYLDVLSLLARAAIREAGLEPAPR